ncbi:unnamed protein product [Adineta steineri]|uniref:Uncharacterized protein n=1 Tax=Adineta steineri TaxID=433720 RepID=A0A814NPL4_9BILA|nr:unnamed protein product [Adineta steineri]CAF1094170.1 unnamed protein product [Adineta steineri]
MNNKFCSKSTTQRTRDCMRQYRLARRESEVFRVLRNNEHKDEDDDFMDISNSLDPVAGDISDNDAVVMIDQAVSLSSSSLTLSSDAELYDEAD